MNDTVAIVTLRHNEFDAALAWRDAYHLWVTGRLTQEQWVAANDRLTRARNAVSAWIEARVDRELGLPDLPDLTPANMGPD